MSKAISRSIKGSDYVQRRDMRRARTRDDDWREDGLYENRGRFDEDEDDDIHDDARRGEFAAAEEADEDDRRPEDITRRLARRVENARREREPRRWRDEAPRPRDDRRTESFNHPRRMRDETRDSSSMSARPAPRGAEIDPQALVESTAARIERRVAASERQTARALENIAALIESNPARSEQRSLKKAVAAVERRAHHAERRAAQAISNVAELIGARDRNKPTEALDAVVDRLCRIESKISQASAPTSARPIRTALARLEQRLDRLSHEDRTADFEQALTGLDQRLADIASRLDEDARSHQTRAASFNGASHSALQSGLRQPAPARRPLADAIAEITHRQRALSDGAAPLVADEPASADPARFDALASSINSISQQIDAVSRNAGERADQQLVVMRQIEGLRHEMDGLSKAIDALAPRASVAAIEGALRDLSRRIDIQRDRGVGDSLLTPVERVADELHAAIKRLDPSVIVRTLHADVQAIGRRLDELQRPGETPGALQPAQADALAAMRRETGDIKQLLTTLVARPLPLEKLETRLFDLTQRVGTLAVGGGAGASEIDESLRAIRAIVAAETSKGFEGFNQRLEHLAAKVDEIVFKSGAKRFDELGERIEQMHKSLAQRIDRSASEQKAADTGALEQLVATLGKKIEAALDEKASNPAFDELGRKIEKLESRLHDPAAADSIARIEAMLARPGEERHFGELAQRIDLLGKSLATRFEQGAFGPGGADLTQVEDQVRRLGDRIDAALEPGAGRRDMESLERQIEQLSQKLDRMGETAQVNAADAAGFARPQGRQISELADRIDFMHNALAARIEEGQRTQQQASDTQISDLVDQLAQKMKAAMDPAADGAAMLSLERQIEQLSQRLDRSPGEASALASIEQKIGDLVARIEETRTAASDAAERAVAVATRNILREAAQGETGVLHQAVEQELSEIRKTQDESGRRTHETLSAVHETLERVVDRLAVFEDELTEIRTTPLVPANPSPQAAMPEREEPAPAPSRQPVAPASSAPRGEERRRSVIEDDELDGLEDFLLEPGRRNSGRGVEAPRASDRVAAVDPRGSAIQSDFIAAARRAAQQAAADADAAAAVQAQQTTRRNGTAARREPEALGAGATAQRSRLLERKRPLLLSLAALVALAGIYQMRESVTGPTSVAPVAHENVSGAAAPVAPVDAANTPATDGAASDAPAKDLSPIAPTPKLAAPQPAAPVGPDAAPMAPGARPPAMTVPPGMAPMQVKPLGKAAEGADLTPVGSTGSTEAIAAIKASAQQGDATGQYELAARYVEGRGLPRDPKLGAQWFEKAATQGLAPAQYRLGSMYEKGIGVDRDYARARKWYESAANVGNARAMHNLAVLSAEGNDGKPDYAAAAGWFRKAAELGVRDSQYNLAILYARGLGVTASLPQSYLWFAVAAEQGDVDAGKKRDEVAARLDSKELGAAKALVDGFKAKTPDRDANDVTPPKGGWENVKAPGAPAPKTGRPKLSQL
jgi:localization factor PodJL